MYVDPGKKAKSLVAAAAADAFIGVTLPQMGRLLDHYSVPHEGRRPISEYDMASCFVKWQFPALPKDEVEAIVQTRSLRSKPVFASVLTPDNAEVLAQDEGAEGKDQVDSMMQQADHYVKSLKEQAKVKVKPNLDKVGIDIASSGQTPASSSGPLPSALSWMALPTLPEAAHDQQTASKFLPVVKSCTIAIHKKSPWQVKDPKPDFPRSHTRSYTPGDQASANQALRECLLWAWRAHRSLTGQPCPYNLGAAV